MRRLSALIAGALTAAGALSPVLAQKVPPASTRRAAVGATPAATPASGKVLHAPPAQPAPADSEAPAAVKPQAARPAAPAGAAFTAGLAMRGFGGGGTDAALDYTGRLAMRLDSAVEALVAVFRNTAGQPVFGARSPATLSARERGRWSRCRDLYWDLTTYTTALASVRPALPPDAGLRLAAAQLDTSFAADTAVVECDNIASMIAAPGRWTPWQSQYESAARHFYHDFYGQIREVHERLRALVFALNAAGGSRHHVPMPPGLPANPPYAGAGPS